MFRFTSSVMCCYCRYRICPIQIIGIHNKEEICCVILIYLCDVIINDNFNWLIKISLYLQVGASGLSLEAISRIKKGWDVLDKLMLLGTTTSTSGAYKSWNPQHKGLFCWHFQYIVFVQNSEFLKSTLNKLFCQ